MNEEPIFQNIIKRFLENLSKTKEIGPELAVEIHMLMKQKEVVDKESLEKVLKTHAETKDEITKA